VRLLKWPKTWSCPAAILCNAGNRQALQQSAEAIRNEINVPIPGQRVQTLGRIICLLRKDKLKTVLKPSTDRALPATNR
jgi:hypothetical protein